MRLSRVLPLFLAVTIAALAGCGGSRASSETPLQAWMSRSPMYVAHRGGDGNWPEDTAYAYRQAAAWNPELALEASVWRTSDGVWVISEDPGTGRVFDRDLRIPATPWSVLATLRTRVGHYPMARLRQDVLDVYGSSRILFIDNKADDHAAEFLHLLSSYAGRARYVVKSFWASDTTARAARKQGYLTWGYYFPRDMAHVRATQSRFDLLGLAASASRRDFAGLEATGKPVIAHVIDSPDQARAALDKGASGLMVADVTAVVPAGRPG